MPNQHCIRGTFPEDENDTRMYQSEYHLGRQQYARHAQERPSSDRYGEGFANGWNQAMRAIAALSDEGGDDG
jgi:hypothetical protein